MSLILYTHNSTPKRNKGKKESSDVGKEESKENNLQQDSPGKIQTVDYNRNG
jgi:hypothetical protein